jgi:hypothetical protein
MRANSSTSVPLDRLNRSGRRWRCVARLRGNLSPLRTLALAGLFLFAGPWADDRARGQNGIDLAGFSKLSMEELHLKTDGPMTPRPARDPAAKTPDKGRVLRGLIVSENIDSVDFMEIRRPPGRRMFLIMQWRYPQEKIDEVVRLPDPQRQQLEQLIHDFKSAEAPPQIEMTRGGDGGSATWHCEIATLLPADSGAAGKLIVDSTAEEQTTRLSILRIEQIFAAYAEILPPRRARPAAPLQINLFGAMQQYHDFLDGQGLRLENPAVYIPAKNLLAAGSELSAYAEQLKDVRRRHAELHKEYDDLAKRMPGYLVQFRKDLAAGGYSKDEQSRFARAAENRWKKQQDELDQQIHSAEQKNFDEFNRVTQRMFVRLFHEAFHAYLENYVYPQADHDVPRWLNEGLAQVFEGGQLESGSLRLDAPDAARLKLLQQDLRSPQVLSLAELLTADQGRFLVLHPGGVQASQRYYLYSWGLAYYLAFRQPLLETPALDRYVDPAAAKQSPIERFQTLVNMPLAEFEANWRGEILKMNPVGR